MKGSWWVGESELDEKQSEIITYSPDTSFLIIGPPGCGKTNLLLLRANYLYLSGLKDILIIVFTRNLRDFIALGGINYSFPDTKVVTSTRWAMDLLFQHGVSFSRKDDFDSNRKQLLSDVEQLCKDNDIKNLYDAILLDEAQDYSPDEIAVFRKLTKRLIIAGDKKQQIYKGKDCLAGLANIVDQTTVLECHYRNGQQICSTADGLGEKWPDYQCMLPGCNYDEKSKPSSVATRSCVNIQEEITKTIKQITIQLKAYPDELIGVITPRNRELAIIWDEILDSSFASISVRRDSNAPLDFSDKARVVVTTMHGAKGLEFRAVHILGSEFLKNFPNQRQLAFTSVTRCKTSLFICHTNQLPGYLESAIASLNPVPELPEISDLFGGE
ncbi:MAG: UvrD-helicase domain-containing protein [Thermodesulfobacteriota bacterium]